MPLSRQAVIDHLVESLRSESFVLAIWQFVLVMDGSVISYELGGWAPPWGIEYRIDIVNAFVALIVNV